MKARRLVATCMMLMPVAAAAQSLGALVPGALVLDMAGEVAPPVEPFGEIAIGASLVVAPGGWMMLEHYMTCETVTVGSGAVAVLRDGFRLDGAEMLALRKGECPGMVRLTDEMAAAGVVLRSFAAPPTVGLAPTILVAGGAAGSDRLRVEQDGREVATLPVRSGRVDWPATGPVLAAGSRYRLVLSGGASEQRVDVVAAQDGPARVILRGD